MTDPLFVTHPFSTGVMTGLMLGGIIARIWVGVAAVVAERRRKSFEDFRSNVKWPPPPGWVWREDQRRLVRR